MVIRRGVCLFLLVLLVSCRNKAPEGAHIDPALRVLVPDDTVLLVGLRLDSLQNTPVYQKYFAHRQLPMEDQFHKVTGVDLRKDVWELLLASNGRESLLFGRGKFSPIDLAPKFEKEGVERMGYKSFTMFGDEDKAVLMINSSVAVAGPTRALRAFVDTKDKKHPDIPPVLAERLAGMPAATQFWAVYAGAPVNVPVPANSNLANINRLLQSVKTGTLSVDFRYGIDAMATGLCNSEAEAQEVVTAIRGLIGIGRLSTKENQPELLRLYDSIMVSQDSREARVKANIASDLVEKFLGQWVK